MYFFIYFNHLSITGLLQLDKFRGRPSWTSSLSLFEVWIHPLVCMIWMWKLWKDRLAQCLLFEFSATICNWILWFYLGCSGPTVPTDVRLFEAVISSLPTAVCFIDYSLTTPEIAALMCPLQSETLQHS